MKFTLSMEVDNDAFDKGIEGVEVINVLHRAIEAFRDFDYALTDFSLFDSNGNKVGRAFVSEAK